MSRSGCRYTVVLRTAPCEVAMDDQVLDDTLTFLERDARVAPAIVSADLVTRTVATTVGVRGVSGPVEAIAAAVGAFQRALVRAGAGKVDLTEVGLELEHADGHLRHEVVAATEVARRIGVSRERVRQLAAVPGRFPAPVGEVRGSRVWRWGDVIDWLAAGGRGRPGRPRVTGQALRTVRLPRLPARTSGRRTKAPSAG